MARQHAQAKCRTFLGSESTVGVLAYRGAIPVIVRSIVRRSAYYDSVTLMWAQRALRSLPGVDEAGVVMGTAANVTLLRQAGLTVESGAPTADDLIVAVRADTDAHAAAALGAFEEMLAHPRGAGSSGAEYRPRTIAAAARLLSGANLALVSVPGRFAAGVARDRVLIDPAHDFGKNTFHGLLLLRHVGDLVNTGWPVLLALSNKDFVGETLGVELTERLEGTLAATALAAAAGTRMFRVHQVAATRRVLEMVASIQGTRPPTRTVRGLA